MPRSSARFILCASICSAAAALVFACADESTAPVSEPDASAPNTRKDGASNADGGSTSDDGKDGGAKDATVKDAKPPRDANGPGEAGAECSFNHDCQLALRCECDGFCACQPGARGTGKNGIDTCDSGDQCASSVCVEGSGDDFYCSDACSSNADCNAALPRCVSTVGFDDPICVRQP